MKTVAEQIREEIKKQGGVSLFPNSIKTYGKH